MECCLSTVAATAASSTFLSFFFKKNLFNGSIWEIVEIKSKQFKFDALSDQKLMDKYALTRTIQPNQMRRPCW
jgi:hypothetical protein